jgi:hypothetical protein
MINLGQAVSDNNNEILTLVKPTLLVAGCKYPKRTF